MNVEIPSGNQSLPKHVIQCKKYGDAPKNVFSRAWQEKLKKERKITQLNTIFHPFAPSALWADLYHFWHVGSRCRRNHPSQILSQLIQGFGGYECSKSEVSH